MIITIENKKVEVTFDLLFMMHNEKRQHIRMLLRDSESCILRLIYKDDKFQLVVFTDHGGIELATVEMPHFDVANAFLEQLWAREYPQHAKLIELKDKIELCTAFVHWFTGFDTWDSNVLEFLEIDLKALADEQAALKETQVYLPG